MKPTYRREIDGLRALAVVPVIFFHAGFELFSGGYIGVDVFFVISGYLITSIIIDDLQNDRFSVLHFYERRARRILPALIFVILVCILFAWMWMLPEDYRRFSNSVATSSIFATNSLFFRESGYFDIASELKPLLHTWSLSVEEQFYVVFPVFLSLIWALGRHRVFWVITLVFALSMLASEWGWRHTPSANYFLAPTRAWELLAGSIAAFIVQKHGVRNNDVISMAALAAVAVSIFAFDERTPVPSLYALLPVGGVFLLILYGGEKTVVARVLGNRVFVGIGLISFSAYLWHQPLFAFTRLRLIDSPSTELMVTLCLATFALAFLTWKYVEQPFRTKDGVVASRFGVFALSGASLFTIGAFGVAGSLSDGFPNRLSAEARLVTDIVEESRYGCVASRGRQAHPIEWCHYTLVENKTDVVFVGDSHSATIRKQAQTLLLDSGIGSYSYSYAGCPGLRGFRVVGHSPSIVQCNEYNEDILTYAREVGAEVLVITSRFPELMLGNGFDNGEGGVEYRGGWRVDTVHTPVTTEIDEAARRKRVLAAYQRELEKLVEEFKVVLVYPIPEVGWNVPRRLTTCMWFGGGECDVTTSYARYLERTEDVRTVFDDVEAPNLFRVYPADFLCNQTAVGRCDGSRNGIPLYSDDDHLADRTGAALLAPLIRDAVQEAMEKRSGTRRGDGLRRQPD